MKNSELIRAHGEVVAQGPFTHTVLRYVHDIGTAEFINVGLVVAMTDVPCVAAKFNTDFRRVKCAFPTLDVEVFVARMKRLQSCFDGIDETWCTELRARVGDSLMALVRSVLPLEDTALHWSPVGADAGGPLPAALQLLYQRFVVIA
ncbi:hypothetical protein GCM10023165_50150 [Variovorax defluvii]|uniref:Uncharacterized protein n=1 Tax=Variovorax defluvii TaxID=913761 RepID=A0ABP8IDS9_9BURK